MTAPDLQAVEYTPADLSDEELAAASTGADPTKRFLDDPAEATVLRMAEARPLMALSATAEQRANANLLGNGFLRRGQGALFVGATGIGKSSFLLQGAIQWSLGEPHFGIRPAHPLTVLFVQAENDEIDLVEMRDGVLAGLNLSAPQIAAVALRVHVVTEHARGLDLFVRIKDEVVRLKPDLLIFDPAFAYIAGGVRDQEAVTAFLRAQIQPFIVRHNLGVIVAHHSNKPPAGTEKATWQGSDFAYAGSGSIEFANWSRGVIYLRTLASGNVFELRCPKRGRRLGLCDARGRPVESVAIRHARNGGIFWELADSAEVQRATLDPDTKRVFVAFHKLGGGTKGIPVKTFAAKLGESERTLRRRFKDGDRLAGDGEALIRRDGIVYLDEN